MAAPEWDGWTVDTDSLPTSWINPETRALSLPEMQNNAAMLTLYFAVTLEQKDAFPYEWTPEAVAAMLGNIRAESSINPARWQNDDIPPDPQTGSEETGYGLVQWTPYDKYREWAKSNGYPDWEGNGEAETARIVWERDNGAQWIALDRFDNMSFTEFSRSELEPEYLANVFLRCYERPKDPDGTQADRESWARYWYEAVVKPIYERNNGIWYWMFPYVFPKKFCGRWFT